MHEKIDDFGPSSSLGTLRARARLNALIRAFFSERGVMEVETPILSAAVNTDPNIDSFIVDGRTGRRFLRTSAEFPMKRLLGADVGSIYELGRVFREGERSTRHNPEFTMLEWYRPGFGLDQLIEETLTLIESSAQAFSRRSGPRLWLSYRALFERFLGIDPFVAPLSEFARLNPGFRGQLDRDGWMQLSLSTLIEPQLPSDGLLVLHDFPASQCALAQISEGPPATAQRFEIYWGAMELANGYLELTDAIEQRARFDADQALRRNAGRACGPLDERLLAALKAGLPACAGVALGVDRLLLKLLDLRSLDQVLAFPAERA